MSDTLPSDANDAPDSKVIFAAVLRPWRPLMGHFAKDSSMLSHEPVGARIGVLTQQRSPTHRLSSSSRCFCWPGRCARSSTFSNMPSVRRHEGGAPLRERRYGAFVRSVRLPEDADAAHVDARIKKEVLTVHIRKDENAASRVRRIEVKKD